MEIIRIKDYKNIEPLPELIATIGAFDGLHLGHQKLIERCLDSSLKSAVITFYPHPDSILKKLSDYPLLMPIEKKEEILNKMGIDYFIIFEFNKEFSMLKKDEFIQILHILNVKELVFGYDFRFGYKGEGSIKDLEKEFKIHEQNKYQIDNVRVSSTYIKELLSDGNIFLANTLLGREYSIRGKTFVGSKLGKSYGFPTANIDYENYYLPENGVYLVKVLMDGAMYYGMANIGHNPTFNFQNKLRFEVHIFDIKEEELYGKTLEVFFLKHLREEIKFKNLEELLNQLRIDKQECINLLNKISNKC